MPQQQGVSVEDLIRQEAAKAGIPVELALAVAEQESGFNPVALGPEIAAGPAKGQRAVGTFQLVPSTAQMLGVDPSDPVQNIQGGTKYLRQLLDQHQGDIEKVLATYGGVVHDQQYVPSVLGKMGRYSSGSAPAPPVPPAQPADQPQDLLGAQSRMAQGGPSQTEMQAAPSTATMLYRGGKKLLTDLASSYDPRTEEGRGNVAATGGAAALTYATGGTGPVAGKAVQWIFQRGIAPWIARVLAAPTGAAIASGAEKALERVAEGKAPQAGEVLSTAAKQAGTELVGQAVVFPVRHIARSELAKHVARTARQRIGTELRTAIDTGRRTVGAAKDRASDLAEAVSEAAARGRVTTSVLPPRSGVLATSRVPAAEIPYAALANTPPSISATETAIRDVLAGLPGVKGPTEGAAARALTEAGQKVRFAAQQGPEIDFTPIRAAATALGEKFRPTPLMGAATPEQEALQGTLTQIRGMLPTASPAATPGLQRQAADLSAELAKMEGAPPNLPGLLGLIENGPEKLGFEDAHKLKMLLDEAVNWDVTAKKHLERITKGLRTTLRDTMRSVNPAYDQATAAYETLVPLYRRGAGRQVTKALVDNPDAVASLLAEKNPMKAQALRKLLVDQSAAGGDAPAGELAWNLVRSQYTYRHLIEGGPAGLGQRVAALVNEHPEFARTVYGDSGGQQMLSNLAKIGGAYDLAAGVLQQEAKSAKRDVVRLGRHFTGEQERLMGEHRRLAESSLGPFLRQQFTEGEAADVVRALALGPTTKWGAISGLRLLLNTPKTSDIVEWAAQSDPRTRGLVRALFTPITDRASAAFWRSAFSAVGRDTTDPEPMASHSQAPPP